MNSRESDISVIVPLYNHKRYVVAALDSVLCQSVRPREIIVIDDGSNDGSFELVQRMYRNEKGLILWTKPNSGAHHSINAGIHRATSSNIAILNSDDVYEPGRLQKCLELLESDHAADVICTELSFIDDEGKKIRNKWYEQARDYYVRNGDLSIALINGNFSMTTSNFVVRRSAFERYGYFGKFRYAHDIAFLLRVLRLGGIVHFDTTPLLQYRIHKANTIGEGVLKVKVELAAVIAEHIVGVCQSGGGVLNKDYMMMLYEVLDRHNLSRMIFPFIATMSVKSLSGIGVDDLLADEELSRFMLAIAQ